MSITILSPLAGWATPLAEVPDPVFAEKMLGDGVAIDPVEGRLVAPGDGVVISIHPASHAVTVQLDAGPVLLLHIGLDTVGLGGVGFTPHVVDGQRVAAGDLLIEFDLDRLARTVKSLITPVVVTNGDAFTLVSAVNGEAVAAGAVLLELRPTGAALGSEVQAATVSRALLLPLAQGLHARPAARVAALAGAHPGTLEIVGPTGRVASARSAVAMLALALPHGAAITVRGSDAGGVDALADLLESGMGEYLAIAPAPVAPPARATPSALTGVVAVPGIAIGPAFRLVVADPAVPERGADAAVERAALIAAKNQVRAALETQAAGEGPPAGIAAAHLAFLDDPELHAASLATIAAGSSAGLAWRQAIAGHADALRGAGDPRFAERADDLLDLERRVLAALYGEPDLPHPPAGSILVTDDLLPSQLMALADAGLAGIATGKGGPTSHVAIIAAGLGLPMLVSLGPDLAAVADGTLLVIDGERLLVAPDAASVERLHAAAATRAARRKAAMVRAQETAVTVDGTRIEVFANLGSVADARAAVAEGAEGCGLLRTEFLFLDRAAAPDEEEQRVTYQAIADALGPRPLIVRTLDIGADKPAPYLPIAAEENPALGLRGIRLQLAIPGLLDTQLRALLGVRPQVPLRIMLPMVADRGELLAARDALDRNAAAMGIAAPELGIMVETPAAALSAASLAGDAAFFSIGSNDLAQYTLARDRTNPAVATGLDGLHPAILRLIAETARGGAAHGRWTGVCGGLAAEPAAIPILLGLGITELSVPAAAIAETKALVRTLSLAACRALALEALAAPDAVAVRALVHPLLEQAA
ncbi:MAG: phosphoenolpyruvate-protein phosphotransferase [Sphingomonas bacterium]|uniref:phosphoenolpyruvate--protein phosphotransferase n=1 Tax=Sphingomonas bacterium TaxID=1895847 RepID=UPI002633CA80|nr:phosphoenolpyruvate--protein phosphotransferase [Sphingomonas bacterium]MDB5712323.1 phosphoenolpyruvate-protein phosphotransferase [Sphingomonas bacterium]